MSTIALPEVQSFEANRPHLMGIAYRMTGSVADAEDLVQEAWVRWDAADKATVERPRSFLATVVSRLAIDHQRSARVRREQYVGPWLPEPIDGALLAGEVEPEATAIAKETVAYAFLVLLERLGPVERAVLLLRDVFDYDYREISEITGRSEAACRQVLHRARARIAEGRPRYVATYDDRMRLSAAFLAAAGSGDMATLVSLLSADARITSDSDGKRLAALNVITGAEKVARALIGFGQKEPAERVDLLMVNGEPAFALYFEGELRTIAMAELGDAGHISAISIIRNPAKLARLPAGTRIL